MYGILAEQISQEGYMRGLMFRDLGEATTNVCGQTGIQEFLFAVGTESTVVERVLDVLQDECSPEDVFVCGTRSARCASDVGRAQYSPVTSVETGAANTKVEAARATVRASRQIMVKERVGVDGDTRNDWVCGCCGTQCTLQFLYYADRNPEWSLYRV